MEEKLDFMIKYLTKESGKDPDIDMPVTLEEKEKLWRALCNIRMPNPISDEYLKVQDEYLQERLDNLEITDSKDVKTLDKLYPDSKIPNGDRMALWQGDITKIKADAIVNAANSKGLRMFPTTS